MFSRSVDICACKVFFICEICRSWIWLCFIYIFSIRYPGFLKLKMQSTYGAPVAFVDFQVSFCSFISCAAYIHWPVVKVIQKTSVWASLVLLLAIFNLHELSRKNISCNVQDVGSSTDALNSLQGTILHSSQSGEGMRLEYPLFSFTSFVFLVVESHYLSVFGFCLTRTSDMLNREWACGGSPIDNKKKTNENMNCYLRLQ